ncbi:hypothetical protein NEOLEDRAFT_1023646, partial [Neolentinus lepideus HHB14362 ss-1]
GVWEIPCGHVEPGDATIVDAVVRETRQETGLRVAEVVGEFEHLVYTDAQERKTIQLNFAVTVEDGAVDEHREHAWVGEQDLGAYALTEGMDKVVRDALRW